jgi:Tfp pilus assembly protein PilE
MTGRTHTRSRKGMLLMECLVYMALLFVVLGAAYAAYYRCAENSKRLYQNVDDIVRALQAGERWRDDIRTALAVTASEDSLSLAQSNATVDYVFERNTVWRRAGAQAPLAPFLGGVKASRMERDERHHITGWRWEVELAWREKSPRFRPFYTFEAAPGGGGTR